MTEAGKPRIVPPALVTLTRVAPCRLDPGDGLPAALKGVRDEIARIAGVDDRYSEIIEYRYQQRKGDRPRMYAVEIEVTAK